MRNFTEKATIKNYLIVQPNGVRQALRDGERSEVATIEDYLIVRRRGGLGKVHQLFGNKLNTIIEELNETLAA